MDRESVSKQRWFNTLLSHLNTLTEVKHTAMQTVVLIGNLSEGHRAEKVMCDDH